MKGTNTMLARTDKLFEHSCRPHASAGVCRSRGGASCAFDGAMIVLQCIADAAHLVHGPIACFGNCWESRGTISDKGNLHRRAYTTDLNEMDIVHGAEEKLFDAIVETRRHSGARAIFVYSTCVTGLTGEDLAGVCRKAEEELGIRVIPVDAPGFVGPKNLGNRIAGEVLLDYVIGTGMAVPAVPCGINLIGEYNIAGDLFLIEPLLKRVGIGIQARITGNASFDEIASAHRASLNVVVCSRALINVAREMERRYGIPFIEVSFFGRSEMSRALRGIAKRLDRDPGLPLVRRVETLIEEEEQALRERLAPYRSLRGKRAVLYSGGVKSWSMISALMDLEIEVTAVGTKKATREDEEKIRAILGDSALLAESMTAGKIRDLMRKTRANLLIAGGRNLYLAAKEGYPFVDVNQERHTAYAGYEGLVNLADQIHEAFTFYSGSSGSEPGRIRKEERNVSIDPLKHSPAVGAALALQGVEGALPIIHGAQGCSFLGKALLTRHFREPIAMEGSRIFVEDVVMGSEDCLRSTILDCYKRISPALIAVITTGLTEVKGDLVSSLVRELRQEVGYLIAISAPDYEGGLERGYGEALCGIVDLAIPGPTASRQVNVLAGSHLTPADCGMLREWFGMFGLSPLILPDLSALDGSREEFSATASGGIPISSIRAMGKSKITISIGFGTLPAAESLRCRCGVPYRVFESLSGLSDADRFFAFLCEISGRNMPPILERSRRILVDGMRDARFAFGGKRVVVAQEPDHALGMVRLLQEMGASVPRVVVPTFGSAVDRIPVPEVIVGDYESVGDDFDLLISNSHGAAVARRHGADHYPMGFPVFERLGVNTRCTIGYRGTLDQVNDLGNALLAVGKRWSA